MADPLLDQTSSELDDCDDGDLFQSGQGSPPSGFLHSSSLVHEQEEVDWVSGGCESQPNDPFWVDSLQPTSTASGNCYFFVAFGVFSYCCLGIFF